MAKRTPLYEEHVSLGGKIVEFGGYELPVQYSGVIAEHNAVRSACGLFDVSHMGELVLRGPGALPTIQHIATNDFSTLAVGRVRYSPICYDDGGTVDDILVYRRGEEDYFIVVNAGNHDKDAAWFADHLLPDTKYEDVSEHVAQLALQGPKAASIISRLCDSERLPVKYYSFTDNMTVAGVDCICSRTGYTGEDGFELYCAPERAAELWRALLDAGRGDGLIPCGLGARDTLRLEASMPLYGHELSPEITPVEAGLGAFVKPGKPEFIGRAALVCGDPAQVAAPKRVRVGLKVTDRGIVREHCDIYYKEEKIGATTSGTHCPTLGHAVAMAMVPAELSAVGTRLECDVRGRKLACEIIPLPFYKRSK